MIVPEKLPIVRMDNEHTRYVGTCADGRLFWGYTTFAFSTIFSLDNDNWDSNRKEFVVLHLFKKNGRYSTTRHLFAGTADKADKAEMTRTLESWIAELGEVTYTDIEVCLFQTSINKVTFGLIVNEDNESIDLQPSATISFEEPWNGEYFT